MGQVLEQGLEGWDGIAHSQSLDMPTRLVYD